MRLIELEVDDMRGLRHFSIRPQGKNLVIWGPNGAGKSAVVDAIDFLLTGKVSRLIGKGTAGITLAKHGPHVDSTAAKAKVRALIEIQSGEVIELSRDMSQPDKLVVDADKLELIAPMLAVAKRGQHVLTRREILRFVTSEAGTRATEIQELLNVSEIEEIRKALVSVAHETRDTAAGRRSTLEAARAQVNATVGNATFNVLRIVEKANEARATLGGSKLAAVTAANLKESISPPNTVAKAPDGQLNRTTLAASIAGVRDLLQRRESEQLAANLSQIELIADRLRALPHAISTRRRQLLSLGAELLSDGECPLCGHAWERDELEARLRGELEKADEAIALDRSMMEAATPVRALAQTASVNAAELINASNGLTLTESADGLKQWIERCKPLTEMTTVEAVLELNARLSREEMLEILAPAGLKTMLDTVEGAVASSAPPPPSKDQIAWDTLTRLEENLKALEPAQARYDKAAQAEARAAVLLDQFIQSRDLVLNQLYDDVKQRFVELYRALHGDHEATFDATLKAEGAGLNLAVDFYGHGTHPPHALHSEGHQDSMGLCLYLALSERLTTGVIDLVILDDVVMSVDAEHRRGVCKLLATQFPHRQFLITTHDRTWANQLRSEGVVTKGGTCEFFAWTLEGGPQVHSLSDMWERIDRDMADGDVNASAAKLRRGNEEFFASVGQRIQARVPVNLEARWDQGQLVPAACRQLRDLLKQAKAAANSWGNNELIEELAEIESVANQVIAKSNVEQWAVNPNVHYSGWAQFSPKDFVPVLAAFRDLQDLFMCTGCGSQIGLTFQDSEEVSLRCNCGKVNWNLKAKPKNA